MGHHTRHWFVQRKKNALTRHTASLCTRNNMFKPHGMRTAHKQILVSLPLNSSDFQYRQNITAILQRLKHKVVKSSTQLYRKHDCSHTALAKYTRKYRTSAPAQYKNISRNELRRDSVALPHLHKKVRSYHWIREVCNTGSHDHYFIQASNHCLRHPG